MTTKENYLSKIEYELSVFQGFDGSIHNYSKTWETADKEIKNDDLGRQLRKSSMLKGLLGDDITNDSDAFSRANKILNYVQNNYAWNEKYELFKEVSVKDLIKEKSGSATEINILLHNLLDDNGIDAKPILISTREHGLPAKLFPVISEFNYLIVMVTIDSENYFLDATNKYLSFGEIPFRCLNQYGRLLDFENNSTWIDIAPKKISTVQMLVDVALGNNDNLIGRVKSQKSGYHALSDKEAYFSNQTSYIEKLDEKYDDLEIINHEVKDNNIINAFDFNEEFEIESNLDLSSEIIYFDPFIFKYFDENPFKLKDRTYPIDFGYKDIYSYSCSIDLKDQYEVIELPKDLNISLPKNTGKLLFSINEVDGKLQIYFKVNFNQEIYPSSYYPALKELMSSIVNCQNNSIVILKKK